MRYGLLLLFPCLSGCLFFTGFLNARCGDGVIDLDVGEECDDGNQQNGDGCDQNCQLEGNSPFCGNGLLDAGEECDDGNQQNGDGCDRNCQLEGVPVGCQDGILVLGEVCLFLRNEISLQNTPSRLVAGELNNDGVLDLVVVFQDDNTGLTFLGDGQGGFSPGGSFATGNNPLAPMLGDLDNDGDTDIAVINTAAGRLRAFRNDGNGDFTSFVNLLLVGNAKVSFTDSALGDIDNDGDLDVLISILGEGSAVLLLENEEEAGSFDLPSVLFNVTLPAKLDLGDFDNDGVLELVALRTLFEEISFFENDGGDFEEFVSFPQSSQADLVLGDIESDGDLDVVTVGRDEVGLFTNQGDFAFSAVVEPLAVGGVPNGALGDIDGDRRLELVVVSSEAEEASVLFLSPETSSSPAPVAVEIGAGARQVVAVDVNGDSLTDLATIHAAGNSRVIKIFLNEP